jgi:hypothetical protein
MLNLGYLQQLRCTKLERRVPKLVLYVQKGWSRVYKQTRCKQDVSIGMREIDILITPQEEKSE